MPTRANDATAAAKPMNLVDVLGLEGRSVCESDASPAGIVLYVAAMIVPAVDGCDVLQLK